MITRIHSHLPVEEPKSLVSWLNHKHSLTDKLQKVISESKAILLSQQWVTPTWWDKSFLHIQEEKVFQREIMMRGTHTDYWYARTIIPQKTYSLNPQFFNRLERETLRNLIFETNEVHRVHLTCYSIDEQCIEFYWVKRYLHHLEDILWVRFSEYSYQHAGSFYLMEVLLPELEKVAE